MKTFYVEPAGNDSNDGSMEHPWKTLQGARDAIRKINEWQHGDIIVYFRQGVYPQTAPVEFAPCDSGRNGFYIRYKAYPGEIAILSGGVEVKNWKQHKGNIYKARLNRDTKLRQLYVNDLPAFMARGKTFPITETVGTYGKYSISGNEPWSMDNGEVVQGIEVDKKILNICKNPGDIEICSKAGFGYHTVSLSSVIEKPDTSIAVFSQPMGAIAQSVPVKWGCGFLSNTPELNAVAELCFQNAYEFLITPGSFYFDKEEQMLYYYKRDFEDMANIKIIAPLSDGILSIKGTSIKERIENIEFSGLHIAHSHWSMMNVENSYADTAVQSVCMYTKYKSDGDMNRINYINTTTQGAAVEVGNARGILFSKNKLYNCGAIGISFGNDVIHSSIIENEILNMGSSAINVGDAKHVYIGDGDFQEDVEGICEYIKIENNTIKHTSQLSLQAPAVSVIFGKNINIGSNHIEDTPYTGISLGWGWVNFASINQFVATTKELTSETISVDKSKIPTTSLGNNHICDNVLIKICHLMHDGAAIYTLGEQPNSAITGNTIMDCGGFSHANAIYLDQGSAYFKISGNRCRGYKGSWLFVWGEAALVHHVSVFDNYADVISGTEGDFLHDSEFENAKFINKK